MGERRENDADSLGAFGILLWRIIFFGYNIQCLILLLLWEENAGAQGRGVAVAGTRRGRGVAGAIATNLERS